MDENKRAHDRFTLWLPVKLDARSGRMEAVCRDASPGGILVSGGSELKVGDRVTISFWLSPEEGDAYILGRIVRVDEAAGTAESKAYYCVTQATSEFPLQVIVTGRYHDTFHRIDGAWWFDSRTMFVDQTGDTSQHLKF